MVYSPTTVGGRVVSDWGSGKVDTFGEFWEFWYVFPFFAKKTCSNAFVGAGNEFYAFFYVFQCRGMSPNSF